MKKIIVLILFVILFAFPSNNQAGIVIMRTRDAPAAGYLCSSCPDGAAGGDLVCDDFEGTGYVCDGTPTWAENLDGGVIVEDHSPTGSWTCTNTNDQNLYMEYVGADHVQVATGRTSSPNYAVFYFKITLESLGNNSETYIGYGRDQDDTLGVYILTFAQDGSGNLYFRIGSRQDDNSYTYKTVGTNYYYTVGEEVRVRIDHDATAGSGTATYYFRIEGETEQTVSFTEDEVDDNEHLGYVGFGYVYGDTNYTIEVDFLRVDDDTMPTACSGDSY